VQKINLTISKTNVELQKQAVKLQGDREYFTCEINSWEQGLKGPFQANQEQFIKMRESARGKSVCIFHIEIINFINQIAKRRSI